MCDFCMKMVSLGRAAIPCDACNIIVHAYCLRRAVRAASRGVDLWGCSGTTCGAFHGADANDESLLESSVGVTPHRELQIDGESGSVRLKVRFLPSKSDTAGESGVVGEVKGEPIWGHHTRAVQN